MCDERENSRDEWYGGRMNRTGRLIGDRRGGDRESPGCDAPGKRAREERDGVSGQFQDIESTRLSQLYVSFRSRSFERETRFASSSVMSPALQSSMRCWSIVCMPYSSRPFSMYCSISSR